MSNVPDEANSEEIWSAIKKVAGMLKGHLDGLLSYFRHRLTNAVSEGLNSRIQ